MRIRKLVLNNFRVYKGESSIEFPRLDGKNIHVVSGKNGYGKTTFLTSLIWCLYGKSMSQVEDKYRDDIRSVGGYDKYLLTILNKDLATLEDAEFSVTLFLTDVLIPSIPCDTVVIKRSFSTKTNKEKLIILIDGTENELTKEVGYEVFINDFILPREIAKFFFFDAEKIVSLAEAKSKEELKALSKAYSEVLGIKKYEDLKKSLEVISSKLRRSGANDEQRLKLEKLQEEVNLVEQARVKKQNRLGEIEAELDLLRKRSATIQDELIRAGSELTAEELKELKQKQRRLKEQYDEAKKESRLLMELLPLAMAWKPLKSLVDQLMIEQRIQNKEEKQDIINEELERFGHKISQGLEELLNDSQRTRALNLVHELLEQQVKKFDIKGNRLLNYNGEKVNWIIGLWDYIENSFPTEYKRIVDREKDARFEMNKINKRIKQGEARKNNTLVQELRYQKQEVDSRIELFASEKGLYEGDIQRLTIELASKKKVLSELENKLQVLDKDTRKFETSKVLLEKLRMLTQRIKEEKKYALEKAVLLGLRRLLHKQHLVAQVSIRLEEEVMNIDLLDGEGRIIDKDGLSKGEQQLYATALLKALVDQSGIDFPVFIDSPLQKFDKEHSSNVIKEFYPMVSQQVVLLPLLEKELSKEEFKLLEKHLGSTNLIEHRVDGSTIKNYPPNRLFQQFNKQHDLAY